MKAMTRVQWEVLARHTGPSVSVYLPLHPQDWADQGDVLRLNQLALQAGSQLRSLGQSDDEVQYLLKVIHNLPKLPEWKTRRGAVVAFVNRGLSRTLWLDGKVEAAAWGDDCFHVRPLLPFVVESDQCLLLKLSENHCSLYAGSSDGIARLEVDDLPGSITDARQPNRGEDELQVHALNAGGLGRRGAMFHGHGGQADTQAANWQAYVQHIASAIQRRFPRPDLPLVVVTVERNFAAWRHTSTYPPELQVHVAGNPDHLADHELRDCAAQIVGGFTQRLASAAYEQYQNAKGTTRARAGLGDVITAARSGQVDTLFVDSRAPIAGRYDAQSESIQLADKVAVGDQVDLIELAIRETVRHRGQVYPLERISQTPALAEALLRY